MSLTLPRIVSLVVGIAEGVGVTFIDQSNFKSPHAGVHWVMDWLMIAFVLALIWFPEEIGQVGSHPIGRYGIATPPLILTCFGWLFLLALPIWFYVTSHH